MAGKNVNVNTGSIPASPDIDLGNSGGSADRFKDIVPVGGSGGGVNDTPSGGGGGRDNELIQAPGFGGIIADQTQAEDPFAKLYASPFVDVRNNQPIGSVNRESLRPLAIARGIEMPDTTAPKASAEQQQAQTDDVADYQKVDAGDATRDTRDKAIEATNAEDIDNSLVNFSRAKTRTTAPKRVYNPFTSSGSFGQEQTDNDPTVPVETPKISINISNEKANALTPARHQESAYNEQSPIWETSVKSEYSKTYKRELKKDEKTTFKKGKVRGNAIYTMCSFDPGLSIDEVSVGLYELWEAAKSPGSAVRSLIEAYAKKSGYGPEVFVDEEVFRAVATECFNNSDRPLYVKASKTMLADNANHAVIVRVHDGDAVKIHPVAAPTYNLDFDGDEITIDFEFDAVTYTVENGVKTVVGKFTSELLFDSTNTFVGDLDFWYPRSWGDSIEEVEKKVLDVIKYACGDLKHLPHVKDIAQCIMDMTTDEKAEVGFERLLRLLKSIAMVNRRNRFKITKMHSDLIKAFYDYNNVGPDRYSAYAWMDVASRQDNIEYEFLQDEKNEDGMEVFFIVDEGALPPNFAAILEAHHATIQFHNGNPYFRMFANEAKAALFDERTSDSKWVSKALRKADSREKFSLAMQMETSQTEPYYETTYMRNKIILKVGTLAKHSEFADKDGVLHRKPPLNAIQEMLERFAWAYNFHEGSRELASRNVLASGEVSKAWHEADRVSARFDVEKEKKLKDSKYKKWPEEVQELRNAFTRVYGDFTLQQLFGEEILEEIKADLEKERLKAQKKIDKEIEDGLASGKSADEIFTKRKNPYALPSGWETMTINQLIDGSFWEPIAKNGIPRQKDDPSKLGFYSYFDFLNWLMEKHAGDMTTFGQKFDDVVKSLEKKAVKEKEESKEVDVDVSVVSEFFQLVHRRVFAEYGIKSVKDFMDSWIFDSFKKGHSIKNIVYAATVDVYTMDLREACLNGTTEEILAELRYLSSISPVWETIVRDFTDGEQFHKMFPEVAAEYGCLLNHLLDPSASSDKYVIQLMDAMGINPYNRPLNFKSNHHASSQYDMKDDWLPYNLMVKPGRDSKYKSAADYQTSDWHDFKSTVKPRPDRSLQHRSAEEAKKIANDKDNEGILSRIEMVLRGEKSIFTKIYAEHFASILTAVLEGKYDLSEKSNQPDSGDRGFKYLMQSILGGIFIDMDLRVNSGTVSYLNFKNSPEIITNILFNKKYSEVKIIDEFGNEVEVYRPCLDPSCKSTKDMLAKALEKNPWLDLKVFSANTFSTIYDKVGDEEFKKVRAYDPTLLDISKYCDKPSFHWLAVLLSENIVGVNSVQANARFLTGYEKAVELIRDIENKKYSTAQVIDDFIDNFVNSGVLDSETEDNKASAIQEFTSNLYDILPENDILPSDALYSYIGKEISSPMFRFANKIIDATTSLKTSTATPVNGNITNVYFPSALICSYTNDELTADNDPAGKIDILVSESTQYEEVREYEGLIDRNSGLTIREDTFERIKQEVIDNGDVMTVYLPSEDSSPFGPSEHRAVGDRTLVTETDMQAPVLGRVLQMFRSLSSEMFAMKVKKKGLDGLDSIIKINGAFMSNDGCFVYDIDESADKMSELMRIRAEYASFLEYRFSLDDTGKVVGRNESYNRFTRAEIENLVTFLVKMDSQGNIDVFSLMQFNAVCEHYLYVAYSQEIVDHSRLIAFVTENVREHRPQKTEITELISGPPALKKGEKLELSTTLIASSAPRRIKAKESFAHEILETRRQELEDARAGKKTPEEEKLKYGENYDMIGDHVETDDLKQAMDYGNIYYQTKKNDFDIDAPGVYYNKAKGRYEINFFLMRTNEQPFNDSSVEETGAYNIGESYYSNDEISSVVLDSTGVERLPDAGLKATQYEFENRRFHVEDDTSLKLSDLFAETMARGSQEDQYAFRIASLQDLYHAMKGNVRIDLSGYSAANVEFINEEVVRFYNSLDMAVSIDGTDDGGVYIETTGPSQICAFVVAYNVTKRETTFAPISIAPINSTKNQPVKVQVKGIELQNHIDEKYQTVENGVVNINWEFNGTHKDGVAKMMLHGNESNKAVVDNTPIDVYPDRRDAFDRPINCYVSEAAFASRFNGFEEIMYMFSCVWGARSQGYNFFDNPDTLIMPESNSKDAFEAEETARKIEKARDGIKNGTAGKGVWAWYIKECRNGNGMIHKDPAINAWCLKIAERCLQYGVNPGTFFISQYSKETDGGKVETYNYSRYFDFSILFTPMDVPGFFNFFHACDPRFCNEWDSKEPRDDVFWDYDFKFDVPHAYRELGTGREIVFNYREHVMYGLHFYDSHYSALSGKVRKPNTSKSYLSTFTKATSGSRLSKKELKKVLRARYGVLGGPAEYNYYGEPETTISFDRNPFIGVGAKPIGEPKKEAPKKFPTKTNKETEDVKLDPDKQDHRQPEVDVVPHVAVDDKTHVTTTPQQNVPRETPPAPPVQPVIEEALPTEEPSNVRPGEALGSLKIGGKKKEPVQEKPSAEIPETLSTRANNVAKQEERNGEKENKQEKPKEEKRTQVDELSKIVIGDDEYIVDIYEVEVGIAIGHPEGYLPYYFFSEKSIEDGKLVDTSQRIEEYEKKHEPIEGIILKPINGVIVSKQNPHGLIWDDATPLKVGKTVVGEYMVVDYDGFKMTYVKIENTVYMFPTDLWFDPNLEKFITSKKIKEALVFPYFICGNYIIEPKVSNFEGLKIKRIKDKDILELEGFKKEAGVAVKTAASKVEEVKKEVAAAPKDSPVERAQQQQKKAAEVQAEPKQKQPPAEQKQVARPNDIVSEEPTNEQTDSKPSWMQNIKRPDNADQVILDKFKKSILKSLEPFEQGFEYAKLNLNVEYDENRNIVIVLPHTELGMGIEDYLRGKEGLEDISIRYTSSDTEVLTGAQKTEIQEMAEQAQQESEAAEQAQTTPTSEETQESLPQQETASQQPAKSSWMQNIKQPDNTDQVVLNAFKQSLIRDLKVNNLNAGYLFAKDNLEVEFNENKDIVVVLPDTKESRIVARDLKSIEGREDLSFRFVPEGTEKTTAQPETQVAQPQAESQENLPTDEGDGVRATPGKPIDSIGGGKRRQTDREHRRAEYNERMAQLAEKERREAEALAEAEAAAEAAAAQEVEALKDEQLDDSATSVGDAVEARMKVESLKKSWYDGMSEEDRAVFEASPYQKIKDELDDLMPKAMKYDDVVTLEEFADALTDILNAVAGEFPTIDPVLHPHAISLLNDIERNLRVINDRIGIVSKLSEEPTSYEEISLKNKVETAKRAIHASRHMFNRGVCFNYSLADTKKKNGKSKKNKKNQEMASPYWRATPKGATDKERRIQLQVHEDELLEALGIPANRDGMGLGRGHLDAEKTKIIEKLIMLYYSFSPTDSGIPTGEYDSNGNMKYIDMNASMGDGGTYDIPDEARANAVQVMALNLKSYGFPFHHNGKTPLQSLYGRERVNQRIPDSFMRELWLKSPVIREYYEGNFNAFMKANDAEWENVLDYMEDHRDFWYTNTKGLAAPAFAVLRMERALRDASEPSDTEIADLVIIPADISLQRLHEQSGITDDIAKETAEKVQQEMKRRRRREQSRPPVARRYQKIRNTIDKQTVDIKPVTHVLETMATITQITSAANPLIGAANSFEAAAGNIDTKIVSGVMYKDAGIEAQYRLNADDYRDIKNNRTLTDGSTNAVDAIATGRWDAFALDVEANGVVDANKKFKDYLRLARSGEMKTSEAMSAYIKNEGGAAIGHFVSGFSATKQFTINRVFDVIYMKAFTEARENNPNFDPEQFKKEFMESALKHPDLFLKEQFLSERGRNAVMYAASATVCGNNIINYKLERYMSKHPILNAIATCLSPFYRYMVSLTQRILPMSHTLQYAMAHLGRNLEDGGGADYKFIFDEKSGSGLKYMIMLDLIALPSKMIQLGIIFGIASLLGMEPPDDDNLINTPGEYLIGGRPIKDSWVFRDAFGPMIPIVGTIFAGFTCARTGRQGFDPVDFFFNGMADVASGSGWQFAVDILDFALDIENEISNFEETAAAYEDGEISWLEQKEVELLCIALRQVGRTFDISGYAQSIYRGTFSPITEKNEKSAAYVWAKDGNGELIRVKTTYADMMIRKEAKKSPVIGMMLNLVNFLNGNATNPDKVYTGYMKGEMPDIEITDPFQGALADSLELKKEDTEVDSMRKVQKVINILSNFDSAEEAAQNGVIIPISVRQATVDYIYDYQRYLRQDFYNRKNSKWFGNNKQAQEDWLSNIEKLCDDLSQVADRCWSNTIPSTPDKYNQWVTDYGAYYINKNTGEVGSILDYTFDRENWEKKIYQRGNHKAFLTPGVEIGDDRYHTWNLETPTAWAGDYTNRDKIKELYDGIEIQWGENNGKLATDIMFAGDNSETPLMGQRALKPVQDKQKKASELLVSPKDNKDAWTPLTSGVFAVDTSTSNLVTGDGIAQEVVDDSGNSSRKGNTAYGSGGYNGANGFGAGNKNGGSSIIARPGDIINEDGTKKAVEDLPIFGSNGEAKDSNGDSSNVNGNGVGNTSGSYNGNYSSGSYRSGYRSGSYRSGYASSYRSGGYSSSRSSAPNIYSRATSGGVNAGKAATMYSKQPGYVRFTYLTPKYETKGSREAYKRQDF